LFYKYLAVVLLPIPLSILPVAAPLGNAYVDGTPPPTEFWSLFTENWGYFVWYNCIGWGSLWYTVVDWTYALLKVDMAHKAWIIGTLFTSLFYLVIAKGIGFPVPLGTYLGGAPCFLCQFSLIWYFLPSGWIESNTARQFQLFKVFAFWLGWVTLLFILSIVTSLAFHADGGSMMDYMTSGFFFLIPMLMEVVFNPLMDWVTDINPEFGQHWNLWIACALETYLSFRFSAPEESFWIAWGLLIFIEVTSILSLINIVFAASQRTSDNRMKKFCKKYKMFQPSSESPVLRFVLLLLGVQVCDESEVDSSLLSFVMESHIGICAPLHFCG
jgi:hypothetical protein